MQADFKTFKPVFALIEEIVVQAVELIIRRRASILFGFPDIYFCGSRSPVLKWRTVTARFVDDKRW
jgi:hypothetical protein